MPSNASKDAVAKTIAELEAALPEGEKLQTLDLSHQLIDDSSVEVRIAIRPPSLADAGALEPTRPQRPAPHASSTQES